MPYIRQDRRNDIVNGSLLVGMDLRCPENVGELNFLISTIVDEYLTVSGVNYEELNAVIGVLECLKLELYRRVVVPYEDGKLLENGEVYYCIS